MTQNPGDEQTMSGNLKSNDTMSASTGKPYIAPKLKLYGDVRAITAAVGGSGSKDVGGMGSNQKTQP